MKIFFCIVLLGILATSPKYVLILLGPYDFCPLLGPSLYEIFPLHLVLWKRSLVFPILLFSLISSHWSLRKSFLSLLVLLWNFAFKWVYLSFSPLPLASLFLVIYKRSSENHFAFLLFFFLEMVLIAASYTMIWTSVHSSSGRAPACKSHKLWALHYDWALLEFITFRFTYPKPQQFITYGSYFPTCCWFPLVFCWICVKFLVYQVWLPT